MSQGSGAFLQPSDDETSEDTMFLDMEKESYSTASPIGDTDSETEEEEINMPWPATFERSVRLLAKPIVGEELVMKATESMQVLPPTKLRKNTSLSYLNRGWLTPDPESNPVLGGAKENNDDDNDEKDEGGIFERMGVKKSFSVDWRLRPGGPIPFSLSEKQLKSIQEIKAHKQKILGQKYGAIEEQATTKKKESETQTTKIGDDNNAKSSTSVDEKTTMEQCVFNVANTLMGVGILGLPFVLKMAGWFGGLFAVLSFGLVTWWTAILVGRELNGDPRQSEAFENAFPKSPYSPRKDPSARLRKPIKSFPDIAREAFGQRGTILLSSVMYFELFSCLAAFLVSMGDHLHSLFPYVSQMKFMIVVSVLLMIPTVVCRTPRLLSYLSAVGTFTTVTVVLSVFVMAVWKGNIAPEIVEEQNIQPIASPHYHVNWIASGLPIGYGLVAFCFCGHAVVPSIYNSMERPQDFEKMISYSYVLVLACCVTVAASGYYMFGSTVSDEVTISLEKAPIDAGIAMKGLTWLMTFTVFSKFTLYLFPLALGVEEVIAPYVPNDQLMEISYTLIKFIIIALALSVAIFFPSFSGLCSLVGLICTIIVSVVFPAAAHLKLFGPHLKSWERWVDWLFIVGGAIVATVGTAATIRA